MTLPGTAQLLVFLTLLLVTVRPLGGYMHRVFAGEPTSLSPVLRPVEWIFYRLAGVRPTDEQDWRRYAVSCLAFHVPGVLLLYGLLRLQDFLPCNPASMPPVAPDLALNTAISFASNTSWQSYGSETTLGYLAQMAGISGFGGLSTNTPFYNLTLAFAMLVGRFVVAIPVIALAGSLATKRRVAPSLGTLPTTGGVWVGLLLGVIIIVGGLTYFPALALGPLAEHFEMARGATF